MFSNLTDTCRLSIVTPHSTAEVSIPTDLPLAHLLPALIRHADPGLAEEGLEHDGWILQRLGEEPLDEDLSAAKLRLIDGETLYLRTRDSHWEPFAFDDLIEGVSVTVRGGDGGWASAATRRLCLAGAGVFAVAALPVMVAGNWATAAGGLALL